MWSKGLSNYTDVEKPGKLPSHDLIEWIFLELMFPSFQIKSFVLSGDMMGR